MEKKLEDYLYLYQGSDCLMNKGEKFKLAGVALENIMLCVGYDEGPVYDIFRIEELKLILRPLSSMTDSEKTERDREGGKAWLSVFPMGARANDDLYPGVLKRQAAEVKYLLSKGIDLFGLIESGLAIDATKLP